MSHSATDSQILEAELASIDQDRYNLNDEEFEMDDYPEVEEEDEEVDSKEPFFETNHKKVLYMLAGLPDFYNVENSENVDNVKFAAFNTNSGPSCLINEVTVFPELECPDLIYELLEQSRIFQNKGMYDSSLKRIKQAIDIWSDPSLWIYCTNSKTLEELHAAKVARQNLRTDAQERQQRNINRAERLKLYEAKKLEAEAEAAINNDRIRKERLARSMYGLDDEDGTDMNNDEEELADLDDVYEPCVISEDEYVDMDLLNEEDEIPEILPEVQMEFYAYVWNNVGSICLSKGDDAEALLFFWRAKTTIDEYMDSKENVNQDENQSKNTTTNEDNKEGKEHHMNDLREFLQSTSNNTQQTINEDINKTKENHNVIIIKNADGVLQRVNRSPLFPAVDLQPIKPLRGASPMTALTWSNIGAAAYHLGKHYVGLCCYYAALQIRFKVIDPESDEYVDVGSTLNNIGVCLHALHRYKEAHDYFSSAFEIFSDRLNLVHPRMNVIKTNLSKVAPKCQQVNVDNISNMIKYTSTGPVLQLRQWNVQINDTDKLLAEYGPPPKKKVSKGGKKKKR